MTYGRYSEGTAPQRLGEFISAVHDLLRDITVRSTHYLDERARRTGAIEVGFLSETWRHASFAMAERTEIAQSWLRELSPYDERLTEHGLGEGPELTFKLAGFALAERRYRDVTKNAPGRRVSMDVERPASTFRRILERLSFPWLRTKTWMRRAFRPAAKLALEWANVILGSLDIPGVGALKEYKEATEAALEEI